DFAVAFGCQLLRVPAPDPEILMEADVERMTARRLVRWVSFPWLTDAVHLALTREALWSAYHTEVRSWPLSNIVHIEPRTDPVGDREVAGATEAVVVRRLHRDAEASIRLIGRLHAIVSVAVLLTMATLAGLLWLYNPGARPRPFLVTIGVLAALGIWLLAVSRGLLRLRPWSRWAALAGAMITLAAAVGLLLLVIARAIPHAGGSPDRLAQAVLAGLHLAA